MARQPRIGVIGPGKPATDGRYDLDALTGLAVDVGQLLAACGAVVINGGLGVVLPPGARRSRRRGPSGSVGSAARRREGGGGAR
jgi:hypothetical protein